jgi:host factor-I protein
LGSSASLVASLFTVRTEGWMGKSQVNLQDIFLNQMRKEKIPVTMYLVNGARLTGTIKGFDNFVILMKQENQQLVYKHAISTIIPDKPVELVENIDMKKEAEQSAAQG